MRERLMTERVGATQPPTGSDVPDKCVGAPPLPRLTGNRVTTGATKKRGDWARSTWDATKLLIGFFVLLWACRYIFSLVTGGYSLAARGTIDIIAMIAAPVFGACLIATSVRGFVKRSEQREGNVE